MNYKTELDAMEKRLFSDELIDNMLADHKRKQAEDEIEADEEEYPAAVEELRALLNEPQKNMLNEMESRNLEMLKLGAQYAFKRGLFAAFHQYFEEDRPERPFETWVKGPMQEKRPSSQKLWFTARKTEMEHLYSELQMDLAPGAQGDLVVVYATWEGRINSAMRQGFYLGYRAALQVLREMDQDAPQKMLGSLLLAEHELDLTLTREEREIRDSYRPRT